MSSLTIFIIGFVILAVGLAYGASLAGVPTQWIVVGVLVLLWHCVRRHPDTAEGPVARLKSEVQGAKFKVQNDPGARPVDVECPIAVALLNFELLNFELRAA